MSRHLALVLLAAVTLASCARLTPSTEPTPHEALPLPGTLHLVADPPQAPYPLIIRHMSGVDASGVYHEFAPGETVLVVFANLPGKKGVQVNGRTCVGRYELTTGVETDLLLVLGIDACQIQVVGSHAEGTVHFDPYTEPEVGAP